MQHNERITLPEPDAASAEHSSRVAEFIRARIAEAGGSLSFAEFMQHALYAPGLGYYVAGASKFGTEGDFVTAAEVSPVFGRVLARQCREVLADVGRGAPVAGALTVGLPAAGVGPDNLNRPLMTLGANASPFRRAASRETRAPRTEA